MISSAPSASKERVVAPAESKQPKDWGSPTPVPRPLLLVCSAVVPLGIPMTLLGAWLTGMTTDEPYHVQRMQNLLAHGWYLIDGELLHGRPAPGALNTYVYGPVAGILLHGWNVLWGVERPGQVSASAEAYAFRHLAIALIGLLGVAAVAATARLLLRSWRWGLVAAAVLLAIPMWPGQSMFNVKDVPVGTGYSLVTLGLAVLLAQSPRQNRLRPAAATLVTAGTVLAVGTRPGMWTAVALSCGAFGAMTLANTSLSARERLFRVAQTAMAVAVAAGVLVAIYPAGFGRPWRLLIDSAQASSDFAGIPGVWWYVPVFVLAELPSLLLVVLAMAWLGVAGRVRTALRRPWPPRVMAFALVLLQAGALPALAVVRQSHLYNGLRQLLFACPAVALIITCGISLALVRRDQKGASRHSRAVLVVITSLAVLVPTVAQLRLFPYNYAYASAAVDLAGLPAVDDYWRASLRELEPRIPYGDFIVCGAYTTPSGTTLRRADQGVALAALSRDCRAGFNSPLRLYRTDDVIDDYSVKPTFVAVYTDVVRVGSNCDELAAVGRSPYGRNDPLSAVARCRLVLSPYPSGGIPFTTADSGKDFLLGGWTPAVRQAGVATDAPGASLGFEIPARLTGRALVLDLEARMAPGVRLRVNNEPANYVREGPQHIRLAVSARRAASFGHRRLILTFLAPDHEGAGVTLASLRVHGETR